MHTKDAADVNIEAIAKLFPNCITEVKDPDGTVRKAIDFDILRQELSKDVVEGPAERYQFTWPEKRKAIRTANTPTSMTLRPCREESVDFDNTQNLYIEGDNLEVLKVLKEAYLGKIKMIYIDPPYNTGNDFVYEDDFSQSVAEYNQTSGLYDEEGNMILDNYTKNQTSNGRFHTDWLNMMYPRLKVARDFLTDDGVIFISIDDNEVENLRKICDEVFGEQNFIAPFIWQSTPGSNTGTDIKIVSEYVLCYAKHSTQCTSLGKSTDDEERYTNKDDHFSKRGGYLLNKLDRRMTGQHYSEALNYPITAPDGTKIFPGNSEEKQAHWNWRWSESKVKWGIDNDFILFKKNPNNQWVIYFKQYYKVDNNDNPIVRSVPYQNLVLDVEGANSARGTQEVMELMGAKVFDYPKPLNLIKYVLKIYNDPNALILDFFSGSSTTAHATMQLNAEDGGHRKFIMVQLPENIEESNEIHRYGYRNICDIALERIRRAGKKIQDELDAKAAEGDIFNQGESRKLDTGFRVLKLDTSNMNDIYYRPEEFKTELIADSNVKEDRTNEDLLFQVMLECNLPLSAKIEVQKIEGKEVFSVNDGYLICCFDEDVNEAVITAIAKKKPYYFVMQDASLSSDNVADNFEQIFQAYSKDTIRKIL